MGDIRRLVYDLRPPALAQLGLASALREAALQYGSDSASLNGPRSLRICVEPPDDLPTLPAAVEVAAYRIALEAITNAARHAGAHVCRVSLALTDTLEIEIVDDGVGLPSNYRAGVGIVSMRERAAELGGTCRVERADVAGGTRVRACLPLLTSDQRWIRSKS